MYFQHDGVVPRFCRLRANLHFTLWMCIADDTFSVYVDTRMQRQLQQEEARPACYVTIQKLHYDV